jgi:hypothetical protein
VGVDRLRADSKAGEKSPSNNGGGTVPPQLFSCLHYRLLGPFCLRDKAQATSVFPERTKGHIKGGYPEEIAAFKREQLREAVKSGADMMWWRQRLTNLEEIDTHFLMVR